MAHIFLKIDFPELSNTAIIDKEAPEFCFGDPLDAWILKQLPVEEMTIDGEWSDDFTYNLALKIHGEILAKGFYTRHSTDCTEHCKETCPNDKESWCNSPEFYGVEDEDEEGDEISQDEMRMEEFTPHERSRLV